MREPLQKEFSRVVNLFGMDINVTTNPAEGLFGNVKTFGWERQVKRVSKNSYGSLLCEFI